MAVVDPVVHRAVAAASSDYSLETESPLHAGFFYLYTLLYDIPVIPAKAGIHGLSANTNLEHTGYPLSRA